MLGHFPSLPRHRRFIAVLLLVLAAKGAFVIRFLRPFAYCTPCSPRDVPHRHLTAAREPRVGDAAPSARRP